MKRVKPVEGEYYHVYNRGVDRRNVFEDWSDFYKFAVQMDVFNKEKATGGIHVYNSRLKVVRGLTSNGEEKGQLVEIVAFCLNPNHFHMIVKPLIDKGLEKFMQRLGTGYTMFFNEKRERSGSLFEGSYRLKHVNSNEYLLYLLAYVNLNFIVHGYDENIKFLSSWDEYISPEKAKTKLVNPGIILGQYVSRENFKQNSMETATNIRYKRQEDKELNSLLLE